MPDYDVVIVGAGPAGSATAILLAQRGLRVALLDKARFPRDKACAEYINPEAAAILDRLGLRDAAHQAGAVPFPGMRVFSPGGREMTLDFSADAGRQALGISRRALDALAVQRCRDVGVDVQEGFHVRDVLQEHAAVRGVAGTLRGRPVAITGRVVIGADGHHSAIARLLHLDLPVRWPRRIGLAAHLDGYGLQDSFGEMHVAPHGYCGIAPQEGGRVNAAMVVDMARFERRGGSVEHFFDAALRAYPGITRRMDTATRVTPVGGVGPLARRVRRCCGDGFLLVGDAAGFFDPLTGEGVYDALRGAELAVSVVADALEQGDVSYAALARYEQLRRTAFAGRRRAAWLLQGFARSPGLMDYAVARIQRRPGVAATLTGVLGDYRDARVVSSPGFLFRVLRP